MREHQEWKVYPGYSGSLDYISLKITDDFTGIEWDESEKSYDMVEKVNFIIDVMKVFKPDFSLNGKFICQGEDIEDKWILVIEDDIATKENIDSLMYIENSKARCPECGCEFKVKIKKEDT